MSSLEDKINADYLEAYKQRNQDATAVLRLLRSAIKNTVIDKKHDLSDEEILVILRREVKQREQAIPEYEKGGRQDLAEKERKEIDLIKSYLPKELDEETIRKVVQETINELGATNPSQAGKVIGQVIAKTKGQAAGITIAKIANETLNKQ